MGGKCNWVALRSPLFLFLAFFSLAGLAYGNIRVRGYFLSVVLAWSREGKCTLYALYYPSGTEGLSD